MKLKEKIYIWFLLAKTYILVYGRGFYKVSVKRIQTFISNLSIKIKTQFYNWIISYLKKK
jgi:hypothetical protein